MNKSLDSFIARLYVIKYKVVLVIIVHVEINLYIDDQINLSLLYIFVQMAK